MLTRLQMPSRRNCPRCASPAHYVQTLIGRMTGYSVRKCTRCAYVDPVKVKLYPQSESASVVSR